MIKPEFRFFDTQMGKGVVGELHPLFMGTAALSDGDYLHCAINRADLIINVGHDVVEKPPFFMEHGGAKVIHINFKSASVDNVYFPQLEVVGNIATSVTRIANGAGKTKSHDFAYFMQVRKELQEHIHLGEDDDSFPVKPQRMVWDVRKVMLEDSVIALDNGIYKIWFARNYPATQPNTVLLDNALATMGAGPALRYGGSTIVSRSPRHGDLRRRWLHDEQPGDGNRSALETQSCCAGSAR